jgi:dihydrofolate reductase
LDLIVAVDRNWGIGYKNKLLCSLPSDMKHFVKTTTGKTVIMGRKTLESFPNGKPLKNRQNIVFSKTAKGIEDLFLVNSIDDFKTKIEDLDNSFVIGGSAIYKLLLPYCNHAFITKIDEEFKADAYFPNLDEMDNWEITEELGTIYENGIFASILKYKNAEVKSL